MIIYIDQDAAGCAHMVDTDDTKQGAHYGDPDGGPNLLTITQLLTKLGNNVSHRQKGGWEEPSNLGGTFAGMTRWQALVLQANDKTADPAVRALGLKA